MKKMLLFVFLLAAVLTGCQKTDSIELEGTTWKAEAEEKVYRLYFTNKSECVITISANDDTLSILETNHYTWRYRAEIDNMWGVFFLENGEGMYAAGIVENKTIYLSIYSSVNEPITFKKLN